MTEHPDKTPLQKLIEWNNAQDDARDAAKYRLAQARAIIAAFKKARARTTPDETTTQTAEPSRDGDST